LKITGAQESGEPPKMPLGEGSPRHRGFRGKRAHLEFWRGEKPSAGKRETKQNERYSRRIKRQPEVQGFQKKQSSQQTLGGKGIGYLRHLIEKKPLQMDIRKGGIMERMCPNVAGKTGGLRVHKANTNGQTF